MANVPPIPANVRPTVPLRGTDSVDRKISPTGSQPFDIQVLGSIDGRTQEGEVELKTMADPLLPDAERTSGGPPVIEDSVLQNEFLGPRVRNLLPTPDATQQILPSSQISSISLLSLHGSREVLTPGLTQSTSTGLLPSDATIHEQRSSLMGKLKESRTSSTKRSQRRLSNEIPSVISPWFAPKRSSQIAPRSDSDAESELDSDRPKDSDEDVGNPEEIQADHAFTSTQPIPPPTGLRTSLSYFAPLAALESHFSSKLDVLAIAVTSTQISRAKSRPRHYHLVIYLADPSTTIRSNVQAIAVSIFRPFKQALPLVQQGDAILLRNFKVQSQKQRFMLLSTINSAWAVFRKGEEVQIKGPPVEFGAAERGFVRGLRDWWRTLGAEVKEKLVREIPKDRESNDGKGKWVDGKHELRDGTTYTDLPAKERNGVHELRDGTTYVDEAS